MYNRYTSQKFFLALRTILKNKHFSVFNFAMLLFLGISTNANAAVIFSEIAWMGTTENASDEWIEIYNFSGEPTDITGWTLSDGNSLNIEFSEADGPFIMPPHGVFLLERTDDTSVPGVPASLIYTGVLNNSGATLTMRDADGQIVGELVGGDDWMNIGGNNELKYTAQVTRAGEWVTGIPTPGLPNIEESEELPQNTENMGDTSNGGGGGGPARVVKSSESEPLILPGVTLKLSLAAPDVAYVHQPISFSLEPSGVGSTILASLRYSWNFGDLTTKEGKDVSHLYEYPGKYVVVASAEYKRQNAMVRREITVLPVSFSITKNSDGDVQVNNDARYEVDLSGYSIRGDKTVVFPDNTILLPNATLTIPKEKIGGTDYAWLFDQEQMIVASTLPTQQIAVVDESREIEVAQFVEQIVPPVPVISVQSPSNETVNSNFSFERIVDDIGEEEMVVKKDVSEDSIKNIATVNEANLPIGNDKLPFLGLIGLLSLGILALYASKVRK